MANYLEVVVGGATVGFASILTNFADGLTLSRQVTDPRAHVELCTDRTTSKGGQKGQGARPNEETPQRKTVFEPPFGLDFPPPVP